LEGTISGRKRKLQNTEVIPLETMEQIDGDESERALEEAKSTSSLKNSLRDGHPTFRQKAQTQKMNYTNRREIINSGPQVNLLASKISNCGINVINSPDGNISSALNPSTKVGKVSRQ